MAGSTTQVARGGDAAAGLLALVYARPAQALARARELLATDPGPAAASIAHQAIGVVERDFGQLPTALNLQHSRL